MFQVENNLFVWTWFGKKDYKRNCGSDVRSIVAWGISPDLFPSNYNRLNTYNPTNNTQPTHKHVWEICASRNLRVGQSREAGSWKGKEDQRRTGKRQPELHAGWGRGRNYEAFFLVVVLWSSKQSYLSNSHIPCNRAENRAETECGGVPDLS